MPPRYNAPAEASASPPPVDNDAQDILVIQDFMDTLDQIPPELTRVHSDLNELGAVLYSTLVNLETKLNELIDWIQDPTIDPAQRFQLLQEIAEEAARYKLGGDDKIRVAGGACDGIISHQRHITNLLNSSTLLAQGPPSPYSQAITLYQAPVYTTSSRRQVARAVNSPFGGPVKAGGATTTATGETPTKKKKNRIQALGGEDDASSVTGEKKKAPAKKRKPANRATSPADSLASTSAFATNKPTQPQTARQLAAAMNKAKKAERADDSDDDSDDEDREGPDAASREGSHMGGRSANETPVLSNPTVAPVDKSRRHRGIKRGRGEDDEEELSEGEDEDGRPAAKRNGKKATVVTGELEVLEHDGGADGEVDTQVYCFCRQVSFGEMIGCDDDDCEIEWFHLACVGLDETPSGNWICPQCVERRKKNPKKRASKPKPKKQ